MTEKQREQMEDRRKENNLKKAMAGKAAEAYCKKAGLSLEKLKTQRFNWILDTVIFSQPSDTIPDGLCNDKATMPYPTLIMKEQDGELVFEQTEHTKKYLSN